MALPPPPPPGNLVTAAKRVNRAMFFLGTACLLVGARFFLQPAELERTSVGRTLPGLWDETWSLLYVLGGIAIMIGVAGRRPRLELPGITLAATATIANGVAIFMTNGARAWSQIPLYVLALWVFDGRQRDLRDLPRERRDRDSGPPDGRSERRLRSAVAPVLLLLAAGEASDSSTVTTLLVALLGGGLFTALGQLLLYRPQKRALEGGLQKMAVESARDMLGEARAENAELRLALERTEARIDQLEDERSRLRDRISALERQARTDHEKIAELLTRLDDSRH